MTDKNAIDFYEKRCGTFPRLSYRQTFNALSNVIEEWIDDHRILFAHEFLTYVFGDDLKRFRDGRLVFTNMARMKASTMFNLNKMHVDRFAMRLLIAKEKNKEYAAKYGTISIPYKSVSNVMHIVMEPKTHSMEMLRATLPSIMNKKYKEYMEMRLSNMM